MVGPVQLQSNSSLCCVWHGQGCARHQADFKARGEQSRRSNKNKRTTSVKTKPPKAQRRRTKKEASAPVPAPFHKPVLSVPIATVRVGTDCAGIEVVMVAFEDLNVATDHVFSCERNPKLRAFIQARFHPRTAYADMTARVNTSPGADDENDLNFYIAGIACQNFSRAGLNKGMEDAVDGGHGVLFIYAWDFIKDRKPRSFLLDNVENLVVMHRNTFDT